MAPHILKIGPVAVVSQFLANILCLALLTFTGCGESPHRDRDQLAITPSIPPATLVLPLVEGPRPRMIGDAVMIDIHEMHTSGRVDKENVCVEGIVARSGELMGAPYVNLACPVCSESIHCEGYALANFAFDVDSRVAIRGRISFSKMLADSHPVTQQQFDAAIMAEDSPADALDSYSPSGASGTR